MKTLKTLTLCFTIVLAVACSKESVGTEQSNEQTVEQTRKGGEFLDGGDSDPGDNGYPLGPGEAHVFVDYPFGYSDVDREEFRNEMSLNYTIYAVHLPVNNFRECGNIELWVVNELEYDYYMATGPVSYTHLTLPTKA